MDLMNKVHLIRKYLIWDFFFNFTLCWALSEVWPLLNEICYALTKLYSTDTIHHHMHNTGTCHPPVGGLWAGAKEGRSVLHHRVCLQVLCCAVLPIWFPTELKCCSTPYSSLTGVRLTFRVSG